jgi:hypothetical protein
MKKSGWMSKEKAQQQSINYNKIHGFVISLEKIESLLLSLRLFYGEPQKFFSPFQFVFSKFFMGHNPKDYFGPQKFP